MIGSSVYTHSTKSNNTLIDFPELREDIKVTAKAAIMKSAAIELDGNPFAAMGIMMANAIVDPIIDQVISPAGLQLFFSAGEMSGVGADPNLIFALHHQSMWDNFYYLFLMIQRNFLWSVWRMHTN